MNLNIIQVNKIGNELLTMHQAKVNIYSCTIAHFYSSLMGSLIHHNKHEAWEYLHEMFLIKE